MRRIAVLLVGFLALAGAIGYVATGTLSSSSGGSDGGGAGSAAPRQADGLDHAEGGGVVGELSAPSDGGGSVSVLPGLPEIGPAVIRTATISIEVREGGFADAFDTASLVAGRYGGFVQSSSTAGTRNRSGDLLIRVPSDSFDEAMSDLRALGTVERQELSGQDVSAQFVDLEARLRSWEAQEAVLLDLMGQATSIEATIRVQRELQDVQYRIEEIEGQLRLLEDQTDLATIRVSLHEPGVAPTPKDDGDRPSLAQAWGEALDGFLGVCYAVVVGLGYLIPLTAVAGIAYLAFRRFGARPAAPTA